MGNITTLFRNLSNKQISLIFLCVGLLIYANSLTDGFVSDDFGLIKANPSIKTISKIPDLFFQGTFRDEIGNQWDNSYRPLLLTSFSLINFLFLGSPFGFHLIQLLIHIANTLLIFLIFKKFFSKGLSFLLSLVFLTHPINTEAVVYISAMNEPLFVLFGLLAFYLSQKERRTYTPWLITITLTLSLLSKETGIVFLLIIPVFNYLYKKRELFDSVKLGFYSLAIYAFLRFLVAHIYFPQNPIVPVMTLPFWERMINIPKIVFFYLKTFFYPRDLLFSQSWIVKSLNFVDFYIPLIIDFVFFSAVFFFAIIIYKKNKELFRILLFFFVWFSIGLGIHLQIIPLDQTVADRWFYFPMVGLLGIIGTVASYLNFDKSPRLGFAIPLVLLIIFIFSVRVVVRNANWKDDLTLYTHDILHNPDSHQLEIGLGNLYLSRGDAIEAEKHFVRATSLFPEEFTFSALSAFYLSSGRFERAVESFTRALGYNSNNVNSWVFLGVTKYKLGDREGAIDAVKKARAISPNPAVSEILRTIENGEEINIK